MSFIEIQRVRKGKTLDCHQELRRWIDIIKDVLMWLQLWQPKLHTSKHSNDIYSGI